MIRVFHSEQSGTTPIQLILPGPCRILQVVIAASYSVGVAGSAGVYLVRNANSTAGLPLGSAFNERIIAGIPLNIQAAGQISLTISVTPMLDMANQESLWQVQTATAGSILGDIVVVALF